MKQPGKQAKDGSRSLLSMTGDASSPRGPSTPSAAADAPQREMTPLLQAIREARARNPDPVPLAGPEPEMPMQAADALPPEPTAAPLSEATPKAEPPAAPSWSPSELSGAGLLARMRALRTGTRRKEPEAVAPVPPASVAAAPIAAPVVETPVAPAAPVVAAAPLAVAPSGPDYWRPVIDPMAVLGGIGRGRWLILATTVAGAALGVGIALSTPKVYEAATEILIDPRDLKLVERDLTQAGLPSDATIALVENQVRVLTSGSVLDKVVERLKLDQDPEFNGTAPSFGIGAVIGNLRALLSGGDDGSGDNRFHRVAVNTLAENLHVERGGKTFVIRVGVETHDPEKSAAIANTMADVFLQTYGELQSGTATRATEELTSRLDELRGQVETAERAVEAFKAENDLVDASGRRIADDEILKLNEQLATARARTAELDARAASTRAAGPDSTLPEGVASSVVTELRAQYASLKSEADRLAVRLGPRHPQRQAVDAQLAGVRAELESELDRIASAIGVEQARARALQDELSSRLAQLKVRQNAISGDLVSLRELEREAAAKRAVYEAYLLRARETGEQQGINTANMSVISTAYPPLKPLGPSRATIAMTGTAAGFGLGVMLAALGGAWGSVRRRMAEDRVERLAARTVAAFPPQPVVATPPTRSEVEEVRASLHALREAVRDLSEARSSAH